jgi:two-component system, NtrC family, sensor kinase
MSKTHPSSARFSQSWPWIVALIIFLGGLAATYWGYQTGQKRNIDEVNKALADKLRGAQGRATGYAALSDEGMRGIAAYMSSVNAVDADTFRKIGGNMLVPGHPEILALGWAARELPIIVEGAASPIVPPGVVELGIGGNPQPAGLRDAYYPIRAEAFGEKGDAALGLRQGWLGVDMASREEWRKAIDQSTKNEGIGLSHTAFKPEQMLVFVRATKIGADTNTPPDGYLVAVVDRTFLMRLSVAAFKPDGLRRQLVDVTEPPARTMLYSSGSVGQDELIKTRLGTVNARNFMKSDSVETFGRNWQLNLQPEAAFFDDHTSGLPTTIAWGGVLFSALLAGLIGELLSRNTRIKQEIKARGIELDAAYQKLRDSELVAMQSEKMSSLGQMVAGVAHEINTPLGFVSSNVQLMKDLSEKVRTLLHKQEKLLAALTQWGSLTPEQRKRWHQLALIQGQELKAARQQGLTEDLGGLVDESLQGLDRLTDLVQTLKNFSRVDRAMVDDIDLNQCIEDTLKIAQNVIKHKAEVSKRLGQIPSISCNPSQINQVLLNLITNAAQAIEQFGKIEISSTLDVDDVVVSITDNGKGIAADQLEKIFEPFYTTKEVGHGTGLGLSISQRIVQAHGGDLTVVSQPGLGTTFNIRLPVRAIPKNFSMEQDDNPFAMV